MPADPLLPLVGLPGVGPAVEAARAGVDDLLANRVLRRRSADVSAESALRGAWASAWLSGAEFSLDEVRRGSAAADPVVQGALRAQAAVASLTDTWTRAPRQALARLHVLAAADLVPDPDGLGQPSTDPVRRSEIAARLDGLATVLAATQAPAVVVAAVVHGEILALDAFAPAAGVVARAAVRLCLVERGLDPRSLVIVEAGHRELGPAYPSALAEYRSGTPDGVARWVIHCAEAVTAGALETVAVCEAIARG